MGLPDFCQRLLQRLSRVSCAAVKSAGINPAGEGITDGQQHQPDSEQQQAQHIAGGENRGFFKDFQISAEPNQCSQSYRQGRCLQSAGVLAIKELTIGIGEFVVRLMFPMRAYVKQNQCDSNGCNG